MSVPPLHRIVVSSLALILASVLLLALSHPARGQTAGIVTDDLYLNYDLDRTIDGEWRPTVAPGAFGNLLGISSANSTQTTDAAVLLNLDTFHSVNTGSRADGFTVTGGTWGGVVGTGAESRSNSQEFWIRPENVNQTRAIIWETGGGTGHSLTYNDDGTNAHLVFRIANGQTAPVVGNSDEKLVSVDLRNFNPGGAGSPVDLVAAQDFIQIVAVQDYVNNALTLYVNGQLIGSTPNSVFNADDFTGGDAQSLFGAGGANIGAFGAQTTNTEFRIDDGVPGNGNGTVLSTGQYSGFRGDVAIHRTYASETDNTAAILDASEVLQNFLAVNPNDIVFNNGGADNLWSNNANWMGGNAPTAAENAYIVGNGATITANTDAAGQVANNVLIGRAEGAGSGDGVLNVNGAASVLTVTNDLWLGSFGGNGTLNVSNGSMVVGQDVRFDAQAAGGGVGGTINVSGGELEIGRNVSVLGTGSLADLNLSGTGTLFFSDGRVDDRTVGNFTQTGTSTLRFALFKPNGFTPLNVTGTANIDVGAQLRIGTPGVPPANPLIETNWTAGTAQWDPDAASKWDAGRPDGVAVIGIGDTIDVITTTSGFADGDLPSFTGPDTNWTPSYSGNNLIATRTGSALDLGPLHAVFNAAGETITRTTDVLVRESDAGQGADVARLSVRDGTLSLTGGANLILGGTEFGEVFVGELSPTGTPTPILNVGGSVILGSGAGSTGGRFNVLNGAVVNVTGDIVASDPTVVGGELNISGGTLNMTGTINVPTLLIGGTKGAPGSHTLTAGQTLTAVNMTVGEVAAGTFINNGGDVVVTNRLLIGNFDDNAGVGSADLSTYTQNTGTTTVTGEVALGDGINNGADGAQLNIVDGTFIVNGGLRVAFSTTSGQTDRATVTVGNGTSNPTLVVAGGNIETAQNHRGAFILNSGTVFLETANLLIGQGAASDSDTDLLGGVMDLRSQSGAATTLDINFNTGTGRLTIDGADVFVSRDINMGSNTANNQPRTNRLELVSGNLYVRDDINTRNNGVNPSNKVDVIDIDGGSLIFGEGFATGADGGSAINFEANAGQAGVNTFNVFDWSGGTIRGLDAVTGIANITGDDAGAVLSAGGGAGIFRQKGGTFVMEAGTTVFDGNVAVDAAATWQVFFTADDALSVTPNPTPNRAAFIDADGVLGTASAGAQTFAIADGASFDLRGSGGAGDTTLLNAVTFDAGTSLNWDATANNWTMDVLPAVAASGTVATVGAQFVIAESSEAAIVANVGALNLIGDTNWTLSLGTNDQSGALSITNNQLIATRTTTDLIGQAAALAIINGTAGGTVQRSGDLLLSTEANSGADAAALQVDAEGLNVTGNMIIGSGATGQPGESFVNHSAGTVAIGGDLVFGESSGANGGEYTLGNGTLNVTGGIVLNTVGENADFNFDGNGTATFGGTFQVEDLGIGRKAGSMGILSLNDQVIQVMDDVIIGDEATSNGSLTVLGASGFGGAVTDLVVARAGTGTATFGDNTAGTQPTLNFIRADVGVDNGSDGTLSIVNGSYTGTGGFFVATNAGSMGAVVIGDGTANSNPVINISGGNTETANGGVGVITINSGTYNQNTNNIIVGQVDGSDATLNINGGAVNVPGQLRISNGGKGVVNLAGGLLTVNGVLDMGNFGGNDGGTLNVSGSGQLQLNNQLVVGNASGQDAPSGVNLTGGRVNVTGNTTIGVTGEGSLTITGVQTGQQHDFGALFIVGSANNATSKGTVVIDLADPGDTVNTGQVRLGSNGQASMELIEGTFNVGGSFNVAYTANSSAANLRTATLTIGDGTSSPTLNVTGGNFEAALAGTGVTTIKSGTYNQNSNNLIIGQNSGSEATFVVENGDVNVAGAGIIRIGNQSGVTAAFEVQNGTVDAGSLDFGGNAAAGASTNVGSYTQSGGAVTVGDFSIANGANTVTVSNGSLMVNNMNFDADALDVGSTFDFSGGTVTLGGNMDFRGGFTDVSVGGGTDLNIGGSLLFDGGGTIANPNRFAISGSGATINIGQNFTMTGTDQRILSFEALAASAVPVSILDVLGDVSLGGTLELIGFDLLDWSGVFGGGTGTVTLINNQGTNSVAGLFQQTDGLVWNEGDAWTVDPQWTLSYLGGTGNDVVLNYTLIPEPSRAVLLLAGLMGLVMRRRRS